MLETTDLECQRGDRRLFAGVGFRLEDGELLYLQGSNGSGKTSLCNVLTGRTRPTDNDARGVTSRSHSYAPFEAQGHRIAKAYGVASAEDFTGAVRASTQSETERPLVITCGH